jgi:tetratricopeptide (TPR) repeat protein
MQSLSRSLLTTAALLMAVVVCLLAGAAPQHPATNHIAAAKPTTLHHAPDDSASVAPISLSDADGQELILEELSVRTAIHGMLSLTELELRFRNPKAKRIEGRFACTLPANAAISRFAKEVNGQLMEGEVVERLRANQVYEQFLHQMRDPALLEQDQGNRFSARIFPIEGNASVRIVLSYSTLLPLKDGVRSYSLPLRGLPKVGHFTFRGFVTPMPGEQPVAEARARAEMSGPAGARHSSADVISMDERDFTPPHDIELAWHPTEEAPRARVVRAGDFYLASFRPAVHEASTAAPSSWLFYVDSSASSAEGAEHRIQALETLLAALPAGDRVEVRAFDQELKTLTSGSAVQVSHSISAALRERLFLGGTDIAALLRDVAKSAQQHPERGIVIASDLVATLGATEPKELGDLVKAIPPHAIVHALILGPRQEASLARSIIAGRGRVVTVPFTESLVRRSGEAAAALRRPLGGSFDATDAAAEWTYPSHFDDVHEGDEVIVLGKSKSSADPAIRLTGAQSLAAGASSILASATFEPLLQREAYRAYLESLSAREAGEENDGVRHALAGEQVRVSIEQRVVIPRTTMLVLETEWDYQRFGLDRRALAGILTIDAGGIARLDRHDAQVTQLPPRPVIAKSERPLAAARVGPPPPPPSPDEVEGEVLGAVEGGVEGGVAGGVVGGVVGGVITGVAGGDVAAPPAIPASEANERIVAYDAVAETITVAAGAPAGSAAGSGVRASADFVHERSATGPPPAPPAPRVVRQRREERERAKTNGIDWTHPPKATAEELERLRGKLSADPRDREVYNQLSEALAGLGRWNDLRTLALRWQPYDPENPQVYEVLGLADDELGNESEGARANASIIEVATGKPELLQRAGLLLLRDHRASLAETPLRRALELRPDRVNSYRHLALMLWRDGRPAEAARVLERATKQAFPNWYGDAQRVVHEELGYAYRAWMAREPSRREDIAQRARDYAVDLTRHDALRVSIDWETDANDVDLHIVDPAGEECYYSHPENRSGLHLYQDITQGLGPEVIRTGNLERGTYHVGVAYYSAGPMGISRGILVVLRDDGTSAPTVDIHPFRLAEGNREVRYITSVFAK